MFKIFKNYPGLKIGLSQKTDGPMEMSGTENYTNREKFLAKNAGLLKQAVSAKLTHSENVAVVGARDSGTTIPNTDGLVSKDGGVVLTVTVADCYPIYFFTPNENTVGLAHSGWRGSVSNLILNTVNAISAPPGNLLVGVGPGIGPCHFEVQADTLEKFKDFPGTIIKRGRKTFVDLPKVIYTQLIKAGIKPENIEFSGQCTFCENEKYYSYRRDKPQKIEAMLAYIGL